MGGRKKCVGDTSAYSFIYSMVCPCSALGTVLGIWEASGQVQGQLGLHRGDLGAEEGHLTQTGNATKGSWAVVFQKEHQTSGAEGIVEQGYSVPLIYRSFIICHIQRDKYK